MSAFQLTILYRICRRFSCEIYILKCIQIQIKIYNCNSEVRLLLQNYPTARALFGCLDMERSIFGTPNNSNDLLKYIFFLIIFVKVQFQKGVLQGKNQLKVKKHILHVLAAISLVLAWYGSMMKGLKRIRIPNLMDASLYKGLFILVEMIHIKWVICLWAGSLAER